MNGIILNDTATTLELGLNSGTTTNLTKSTIARIQPSAISLMPENLLQACDAQQRKDLMTFLLTPPHNQRTTKPTE